MPKPVEWKILQLDVNRRIGGLCPRCGYDIRANPTRCSECGMELANKRDLRDNPI